MNSSLGGYPNFIYDENGQITGYTTKIGGADSVFPFNISNILYAYICDGTTTIFTKDITLPKGTYNLRISSFVFGQGKLSGGFAYITINGVKHYNGETITVDTETVGSIYIGSSGWQNLGGIIITKVS